MKLKMFILTLPSSVPIVGTSKQMQGFFTEQFPDLEWFSQHDGEKYKFRYPLVQHKIIDEKMAVGIDDCIDYRGKKFRYPYIKDKIINGPMIVGINNGIDDMAKMYDQFKCIKLGDSSYDIPERIVHVDEYEFGISDRIHKYRFITPIMAFDKENNKKFDSLSVTEIEKSLAKRINTYIVDHMSKMLGYDVPERLKTDFKLAGTTVTLFKGIYMKTVYGDFSTNFKIPNYLSIGKAKSIGFGTVAEMDTKEKDLPE